MELGLVLLPLLLLLLGIVEFGRVFYTQLRLQHAAQEAARTIALHTDDPGLGAGILDVVDDVLTSALGGVVDGLDDLKVLNVTYCDPPPEDSRARVVLTQEVNLALPLPDTTTWDTITVAGAATMRCKG